MRRSNLLSTTSAGPAANSKDAHRIRRSFPAQLNGTYLIHASSAHPEDSSAPRASKLTSGEGDARRSRQSVKFNRTVGSIVIAEHKDIEFNCSIHVPKSLINQDSALITLWKNGKEALHADRLASRFYQVDDGDVISMIATFR